MASNDQQQTKKMLSEEEHRKTIDQHAKYSKMQRKQLKLAAVETLQDINRSGNSEIRRRKRGDLFKEVAGIEKNELNLDQERHDYKDEKGKVIKGVGKEKGPARYIPDREKEHHINLKKYPLISKRLGPRMHEVIKKAHPKAGPKQLRLTRKVSSNFGFGTRWDKVGHKEDPNYIKGQDSTKGGKKRRSKKKSRRSYKKRKSRRSHKKRKSRRSHKKRKSRRRRRTKRRR